MFGHPVFFKILQCLVVYYQLTVVSVLIAFSAGGALDLSDIELVCLRVKLEAELVRARSINVYVSQLYVLFLLLWGLLCTVVYYVNVVIYRLSRLTINNPGWSPHLLSSVCMRGFLMAVALLLLRTTQARGQRWVVRKHRVLADMLAHVQPRVLPQLMSCGSVVGVGPHALVDQLSRAGWNVVRDNEVAYLDLLVQVSVV
jgi:hypothetical protein